MEKLDWKKGEYLVSTDPSLLDVERTLRPRIFASSAARSDPPSSTGSSFDQKARAIEWLIPSSKS